MRITITIVLFCSTLTLQAYNIIFDLGNVLVVNDMIATFKQTGAQPFARYLLYTLVTNPKKLFTISSSIRYELLFNCFNAVKPHTANAVQAYDENGVLLPQIIHDWISGTSGATVLHQLNTFINNNSHHFRNNAEKQLAISMSTVFFMPHSSAKMFRLVDQAADLVKMCKQQGHNVYILSNWNKESFDIFKKRHAHFFKLFDGSVTSGDVGIPKPHPAIYIHLLKQYNLNPKESIFIDDQEINIKTANKLGIAGIVCPQKQTVFSCWQRKPDIDTVRKKLQTWLSTHTTKNVLPVS